MKKHSVLFKSLSSLLCVIVAITGFRTSVFAATSTSLSCDYLLCSNKVQVTSPLKAGSKVPSGIPVYGGSSLTTIDSSLNDSDMHYVIMYCTNYNTSSTIKKRHTMSVCHAYHKYDVALNEYKILKPGDYVVRKFLNNQSRPASLYEDSENKIIMEYAPDSFDFYYHYRKYSCGSTYLIHFVTHIGTGNEHTINDMESVMSGLGGCGYSDYFVESHNRQQQYLGHNSTEGLFLYTDANGNHCQASSSEIKYDSTVKGYVLPNSPFYFNTSTPITDNGDYSSILLFLYAYSIDDDSDVVVNYIPKKNVCNYKYFCDDCGWYKNYQAFGTPKTTCVFSNSSTHRLKTTCTSCGEVYRDITENHKWKTPSYEVVSETSHKVTNTCQNLVCKYSDTVTENHDWVYSSYKSSDGTNHTFVKTCSGCKYSETVSEKHSLSYGDWTSKNESSHIRTVKCDKCDYSTTQSSNHSLKTTYASISSTQHIIENACDCGYKQEVSYGDHHDDDSDCYCDDCGYLMTMFSVTVPSTMSLVMDKNGNVYSATNASITNNSTDSVKVSSVKVTGQNGWTVTDYNTNMANEKVDSKKIGFKMNESTTNSNGEFSMNNVWGINKGSSLALPYTAVVSATSTPINNQEVLKVVFIIDWSDG